jgi:hypothetical protein
MEQADFTFRNETGETIFVRHDLKDIKNEQFTIKHLHSKTIQVDIEPQTYEKYWVHDSADKATGKYVSSDEYKNNEQVTVVKDGGEFQLKFHARYKLTFPAAWNKLNTKLPMHSCYGRSIRICLYDYTNFSLTFTI